MKQQKANAATCLESKVGDQVSNGVEEREYKERNKEQGDWRKSSQVR